MGVQEQINDLIKDVATLKALEKVVDGVRTSVIESFNRIESNRNISDEAIAKLREETFSAIAKLEEKVIDLDQRQSRDEGMTQGQEQYVQQKLNKNNYTIAVLMAILAVGSLAIQIIL